MNKKRTPTEEEKEKIEFVYLIEVTTGRTNKGSNARASTHFKVLALSSGQKSIEKKLAVIKNEVINIFY